MAAGFAAASGLTSSGCTGARGMQVEGGPGADELSATFECADYGAVLRGQTGADHLTGSFRPPTTSSSADPASTWRTGAAARTPAGQRSLCIASAPDRSPRFVSDPAGATRVAIPTNRRGAPHVATILRLAGLSSVPWSLPVRRLGSDSTSRTSRRAIASSVSREVRALTAYVVSALASGGARSSVVTAARWTRGRSADWRDPDARRLAGRRRLRPRRRRRARTPAEPKSRDRSSYPTDRTAQAGDRTAQPARAGGRREVRRRVGSEGGPLTPEG